ncbi:sensor histidine kinase [Thermanaeromonas toyohensis]|uniref:sensor histidine kinase n=1 Tax=Thermanaeromonas toyohensis TaxID=161154 RepID=UPI0009FCB269|nr:ATP-binding protein [Thermanaeromonas toyohensis]
MKVEGLVTGSPRVKRWRQLRFRLLVAGVFISVLPLLLLGAYHLNLVGRWQEKSIEEQNRVAAEAIANDIFNLTTQQEGLLQAFSIRYGKELLEMPFKETERILYSILRLSPYLEEVSVVELTGKELARASRRHLVVPGEQRFFYDRELIERVGRGERYYGPVEIEEDGRPLFSLAVPLWDLSRGWPVGGLKAKVSLKGIMDSITKAHAQQGGTIYLIDSTGRLIGHQDFSLVLRQLGVRRNPAVRDFLQGKKPPTRYVSHDGQEVLGAVIPLRDLGWGIIIEYPVSWAMAPVRTAAWHLLALLAVVVALLLLLNSYLSWHFSRPIEELGRAALEVARGNFVEVNLMSSVGELASLQETFNYMSRELREKAKMEALVRQTDKLAAVGRLAAGVAHEINNPLAIVSAYTEDFLERLEEGGTTCFKEGEWKAYLTAVLRQVARCTSIIRKLLDFARPAPGLREWVKINELVQGIVSLMDYTLKKKGIELTLKIEEDLEVYADRLQLEQVLLNLLTNAVEAIEKEGKICIKAIKKGQEIEISVIDTGKGIPPENLEKIFEPFFTTKPVGQGTGLGLSICYGIIQELGGRMVVESSLGQGTTVKVYLPARQRGGNG